jgi:hypothetical protein
MAGVLPLAGLPPGGLAPGEFVLVKYDLPFPEWHARLLLALVDGSVWVVLTPDADIYTEDISHMNNNLSGWRPYARAVGPPFGIPPGDIYDFNPAPDVVAMAALLGEGSVHATAERARLGLALVPAAVPFGPPPLPPPASAPGPVMGPLAIAGGSAAAPLAAPAGIVFGGGGLAGGGGLSALAASIAAGSGAAGQSAAAPIADDDARTLKITRDEEGNRYKEFREASRSSKIVAFTDWPIGGPRTTKWLMAQMVENGSTPLGHHQLWKAACKFTPSDGPAIEHEAWSKVLQVLVCYDQLDASNLGAAELISRNIQRLEEKHRDRLTTADGDETAILMGSAGGCRGGLLVSPQLQEYIGTELQREALVSKERRKAREERALSRKGGEGGPKK